MKQLITFALLLPLGVWASAPISVSSPDKKIKVTVELSRQVTYSVSYGGTVVLEPSPIDLLLEGGSNLAGDRKGAKTSLQSVSSTITAPVPYQRRSIPDQYNLLTIQFKKPYTIQFRVYNDGVAYRILTRFSDSITIKNEVARFVFPKGRQVRLPLLTPRTDADRFHTSFEELYPLNSIDSLNEAHLAYTPVLVGSGSEVKVGLTESDLEDYPGMFVSGTGSGALQGVFAPYPAKEQMSSGEFPQLLVTERAPYIARTRGTRSFPWRVLLIAPRDKDLPGNDIVYRLASLSRVANTSWIHPGKGTEEWIIGINLFGVPFRSGVNTASYKYYIDFARRFGLQRVMMDAGWSNYRDLFDINPDINMDTISAYAKSKGIKLSMWTLCSTLDRQLDSALDQFNRWGVDFIMTDFMDRDDQVMVNFYHRVARACADHHLMVMFHGAYPPKGLNRTWPNVMTTEGVLGSEYNIWSDKPTPEHDVTLPFTRMLGGPLDYEPGLLDNATRAQFRAIEGRPMSQGTRCHQLAMFVVYDSPVPFFSGNPSQGLMEPAFMELLGSVPTVWDETRVLQAQVSDYIVTARKSGGDWYIGGMTDWTPRELALSFDFLESGSYKATLCRDGTNADKYPADYKIAEFSLQKGATKTLQMAAGGGFLLKLVRQ